MVNVALCRGPHDIVGDDKIVVVAQKQMVGVEKGHVGLTEMNS